MAEVRDEILMMSGNGFINDMEAIGFTTKQFLKVVTNSFRKFLDYRSVLISIQIPYKGSFIINLNEYMNPVPKFVSKVSINGVNVMFRYTDTGMLQLQTVYPGTCVYIQFKTTDGLGMIQMVDPDGDPDDLANWEFNFGDGDTRMSELMDLITANFKIALGGAVRRFQIQEMPIGLDGDSLVSEGKQEAADVINQLQETSDCYITMRTAPDYTLTYRGMVYAAFGVL